MKLSAVVDLKAFRNTEFLQQAGGPSIVRKSQTDD